MSHCTHPQGVREELEGGSWCGHCGSFRWHGDEKFTNPTRAAYIPKKKLKPGFPRYRSRDRVVKARIQHSLTAKGHHRRRR